jgi:hypothetical protein
MSKHSSIDLKLANPAEPCQRAAPLSSFRGFRVFVVRSVPRRKERDARAAERTGTAKADPRVAREDDGKWSPDARG